MFENTIKLKAWFDESLDILKPSRLAGQKTADYANGEQLGDEIKLVLHDRGQPEQWENNISKVDNKISGFKESRKTEIKLFGTQTQDKDAAILLQDTIRAIHEASDFSEEKSSSDEDLRYHGFAAQEIRVIQSDELDNLGRTLKDIEVESIPANQCFLDPFVKKQDYSDARYLHQAFWTDKEELYTDFDKELVDKLPVSTNHTSETELDENTYSDSNRERVLIIYTWYKKYDKQSNSMKIYYAFWGGDVILKQGENPYKEYFDDMPISVSFLRSRKHTQQYAGMYKDVLPLQDALNFAKLKIWHKLGNVKVLVEEGAVDDIVVFKDDYSLDDSVTEVNDISGIKEIKQYNDIAQLLSTVVDCRNQIKEIMGLSDEFLAQASNRMGADALTQRINMGALGLGYFMKASARLQKMTLKKEIPLIQEFYDASRVMKLVDEDTGARYFQINQPSLDANGFMEYEVGADGVAKPLMKNRLNTGKYDLIYTEMEKPITSGQERYRQDIELIKLVKEISPQYAELILPDILADTHSAVSEKLRQILEMQQQTQNDPVDDANTQFDMGKKKLELDEIMSRINLNNQKANQTAGKNNIDIARINQQQNANRLTNKSKGDQALLKAFSQGGRG